MAMGVHPNPTSPHAGISRTTRLVGGLLLLMVMGASIGPETNGRWSHAARVHAAQELAGARRAGERVAKVLWTLVGRQAVESPAATATIPTEPRPCGSVTPAPAPICSAGVALDVWLLDLPPPARA